MQITCPHTLTDKQLDALQDATADLNVTPGLVFALAVRYADVFIVAHIKGLDDIPVIHDIEIIQA